MKFKVCGFLENPKTVTGKSRNIDAPTTPKGVETVVNEQITGLTKEEIEAQGWLHPDGDYHVDAHSGAVGRLV